ncbi:MAG: FHA domain-containing protein [Gammaproteobacteria bacterium]|jgi:type II secretory pathway predicted ATPase ExeA/pSer/pThr/pTyr-binding forkhead associated (FHA) protein|nr:FHA domain-containing protein [Gammaproteobacteria bacterium]MDH3848403.1 FHA domain-containing protein [Gammaproteobacteria bacterium]MDH3862880.1 FHA domain-containing protein [Gammaproteobacteria bacterium]MDH3906504.1 FHA domain-containing protein [Gammaproteobacteria bacterium]MDH3952725.1 FHA domain-containing protein [Gammaproteobacteria bacterium]
MDLKNTDFGERAFGKDSKASAMVKYESQQHALDFIWSTLGSENAIGVIEGPEGSGKSTVIRQFVSELPRDTSIAALDGTRFKPRGFISEILARYGYTTDLQTTEELLQLLAMFAGQQTRSYQPPIVMIDNADRMFPSTLKTLGKIAAMTEDGKPALRIILTSCRRLNALSAEDGKLGAERPIEVKQLAPMTVNEALIYLHARLEACGVGVPDSVFPGDVCDKLHEISKGWPARLNALALTAIKRSEQLPVTVTRIMKRPGKLPAERRPPSLVISKNGKTLREFVFDDKKVLIGRSDFADIVIDDEFCSKFHVLLMLYTDGLVLLDLNSVNGTTVNSVKVKSTLLLNDDVISLGHHRLKIMNVPAPDQVAAGRATAADTRRMKNLDEMRRKRKAQLTAVPSRSRKKS